MNGFVEGRLDYQPLFGKLAPAQPTLTLSLGEECRTRGSGGNRAYVEGTCDLSSSMCCLVDNEPNLFDRLKVQGFRTNSNRENKAVYLKM